MKCCNDQFKNYLAFEANFEPVYIYKASGFYYVFKEPVRGRYMAGFIYCGTKDEVNGWLYGCVQAINGIVAKK